MSQQTKMLGQAAYEARDLYVPRIGPKWSDRFRDVDSITRGWYEHIASTVICEFLKRDGLGDAIEKALENLETEYAMRSQCEGAVLGEQMRSKAAEIAAHLATIKEARRGE